MARTGHGRSLAYAEVEIAVLTSGAVYEAYWTIKGSHPVDPGR